MAACGSCGGSNDLTQRFCRDCGAPLSMRCPSCGSVVQPGKRFCGECGVPQAAGANPRTTDRADPAPTMSTPGSVPVAERRVCSVLFVDLVGFTALAESRDPEEVRESLSEYFGVARTVIARYGGVVEKLSGMR